MGRVTKSDLDYERIDCDFHHKEKMFRLRLDMGRHAVDDALHMLLWMGATEGLFIPLNDLTAGRFAEELGEISETPYVSKLIAKLVEIEFFKIYRDDDGKQYLSSPEIILEWKDIMAKSKRKVNRSRIPEPILQIYDSEGIDSEGKAIDSESITHTKEKKSKVNNLCTPSRAKEKPSEVEITSDGTPITSEDRDNARTAVKAWNESFQGTKQEFPETEILPEDLVLKIRRLRESDKTPERFRESFRNAKRDNFTWTLWLAVKNQANFDQLIAKSGKNPRARSGPPSCGLDGGSDYGDPSKYSATAFE